MHQSRQRCDSASSMVAHRIDAPRSAASDVSHTHSKGNITALGNSAHSQAAALATPGPATRLPAQKIGTHTPDENRALRRTTAKNEARVKTPNTRKIPATNNGYTGVSHAVGPVSLPNGELNPFPVASDLAMLPVS